MMGLSLLSLPQKILGGVMAILLTIATIYGVREHIRAGQWKAQADATAAKLKSEEQAHAITRQSLGSVQRELDIQSRMVSDLASLGDQRKQAALKAQAAAQEAGKAAEVRAKALDASAAAVRPGADKCPPSDVFWNQRGDL
ncbi:hypothetical protein H5J25_13915 [Sphingomonas aliaeris]|uniref:Uncharacterized protein n=1 Tax=Sphingomonas aliaeris TaxID=2759526 RepID=A0A974S3L4_9SPHN|nr:hypothetical protein [Sphingomonas aliaeris]QQV76539.1 hypothetical protein H5J25_13915 [Sphingomonas aliaeris]